MKVFTSKYIFREDSMLRNFSSGFYRSIMMTIAVFLLAGGVSAWAGSLQDLRASGAIGESASGYTVARDPGATAEAASINKQRKAVYAEKAAAQGVTIEQVGKVYAKEIFEKVPAGTWLQNEQGQWLKK
ncbi:MAG: YdbL family protein [Gammaproteobacteria bacterium]|nr:YdbL family protein [Gammaproteobacteria bacterium]MDH3465259.1 YdbL family protein [Gammaproteobacteria bacterium]